jgi:hypothetical protein
MNESRRESIGVHIEATIIVRWRDAEGDKEARFGRDIPWVARAAILTMNNDDWGEILIQNPGSVKEFLWCSGKPEHRIAARRATGASLPRESMS